MTSLTLEAPQHENLYCISSIFCDNELHIANFRSKLAAFSLVNIVVGWLNSGASTLVIRHHSQKVGNFIATL